ncbi:glucose 1-dehydrogenase [Polaromonas sp.]|uniref:SDR family NAD(P)-dependent oxidoreductase n=1 Tax=Polaromonas sp. TaxID=1869339 RepID=UPI0017D25C33|nr:glucose 1-dehydrogenase [Polaromonas sp.]NMM07969.1 glucose 1-dehydrogenase [Polaromonas sp.]
MFDLQGKVALVTGGNGGIGLAMARGLADAGARVAVVGRNPVKLLAAVASLGQQGKESQAKAYAVDVCDEAAVSTLMAQLIEDFGRLDILVNNAGINIRKQVQDLSLTEWNAVMDTNLTSAFLCSRTAFPHLKKQGGKVINIGSMTSIFGASFAPAYSASKGGIVQLTRALATAWAADNIQVNAILPGWIDTELTQKARAEVNGLNERILARTPAGRWGKPQDLAGIAVFLSSAASDFITGTAIPVDGGYSVQA